MGVLMQAFYWDCPKQENQEFQWWNFLTAKIPELKQAGFSALWLPPACKAANMLGNISMGYDPYDYYDLGEYDQKSFVKTWFGSKDELVTLIQTAHANDICVYADMVLNHTSGADQEELNPMDNVMRWTKYTPKSGKFERDWLCYHPSIYERWDDQTFEGMPDICHRNPYVYNEMLEYARWLIEQIGFDGFRYDFVKGYGGWLITAILERLYIKGSNSRYSPFGVGEYFDDNDMHLTEWLQQTNAFSDNPVSVFDFPLRDRLKRMCNHSDFSLTTLIQPGTVVTDGEGRYAVTFVENHDVARSDPVVTDKLLAYAYILTHEGYPCVFWQDYYNYNLAQTGGANGIDALIQVHEKYAGGCTDILFCDDDLYIMQRRGYLEQKGLVFVLSNSFGWNGAIVQTLWPNTTFQPAAYWGKDNASEPEVKHTDMYGVESFWAPPRGYAVYVPV
jgi:alpha-amylase